MKEATKFGKYTWLKGFVYKIVGICLYMLPDCMHNYGSSEVVIVLAILNASLSWTSIISCLK